MTYRLGAGGSERQATELAIRLHQRGWPVRFGCMRREGQFVKRLEDAGIPVVEFPAPSFRSPAYLWQGLRLARYLRQHGIQLVHAFDPPSRLMAVPFARMAGLPAVLTGHRGSLSFFDQKPFMRWAIGRADRWAHGVVANCEAMAAEIRELEGIPPARIHLHYNGLDPDQYQPGEPASPPAYLRRDGREVVIGTVAVLRPEKDLRTLVDAFSQVHSRYPETRLVVVGKGDDEPALRARIAELGLASVAHIEPETRDVQNWLRCLSIFVLPSLTEALSNSLMEAMSCGCACVASRVGGNPELIDDGRTGLLFRAGDAGDLAKQLIRLVSDEPLRNQFRTAARQRIVQDFSLEAATTRLEEIYRSRLGI